MEKRGRLETSGYGHALPRREGERMRHPRVAPVSFVLDHDERPSGSQHLEDGGKDRSLVPHEMQRVGHDHAVQAEKLQRAGAIGSQGLDDSPSFCCCCQSLQCAGVSIDGRDVGAWTNQISQGNGEGARSRPE